MSDRAWALAWLTPLALVAADAGRLPLWPDAPPGETLRLAPGADPRGKLGAGGHRTDVFLPDIEGYPAPAPGAPLVLVFPGGGYNLLAEDHEGTGVARRFRSLGCAAAVVRYRVPRRDPARPWQVPLLDARRALELARGHAAEWNADPAKVVAVGFSAGGNLVARLAYQPGPADLPRPDFAVMVYPAYLLKGDKAGAGLIDGPEGLVPASGTRPAPAFLAHSADDPIPAAGSLALAEALRSAGGSAETHLYPDGGHGWGVTGRCAASREWPELVAAWLRAQGALR